ncbi:MAG: VWA domain-containing protein [Gammaproteobacteria bacterium]|nr:VWA domain-containing protein [Gammaproteobacteria bacterium]MCY4322259.1 VWA domain-containing protein [Gammaproteobacteria bacterium]
MEQTLISFISALRNADVRVSPAETLDAFAATNLIGYAERDTLKRALWLTLPKTPDEKERFDQCFDRFFDVEAIDSNTAADEAPSASASSDLGAMLQSGDDAALSLAMAEAGRETGVSSIQLFTQRGLFTRRIMERMGLGDLNAEIAALRDGSLADLELAQSLGAARDRLRGQVRDYVEREFLLHADHDGRRLREEVLRRVKLSNVDRRNFRHLKAIVLRMAKKLETLASRKRKVFRRGHLHVPRTLRSNMSYDGALFELEWKSKKINRPKVFAVCDVSGSVASYARFMLLFLYSLEAVVPRVRAFAFSSHLGEVTGWFEEHDLEEAITRTLKAFSGGSTDYGQAFEDLHDLCLDEVDQRSTVIILGDARNNYGDPRKTLLHTLYERAGRVIWLNPEPRSSWFAGDAEMRAYLPYCHQARVCNSLEHLERLMTDLVKLGR